MPELLLEIFSEEIPARMQQGAARDLERMASERLKASISPVDDWAGVEAMFADSAAKPGWADVAWSRPTGAELDKVVERLKSLKLTIRNAPMGQTGHPGAPCIFTGGPAVERVLIGRSY